MRFDDALINVYRSRPCQVLPNALWKTESLIEDLNSEFEKDEKITKLMLGDNKNLHLYWTRDRSRFDISDDHLKHYNFALIHEDYINKVPLENFSSVQRYFRLSRKSEEMSTISLSTNYRIKDVDIDSEVEEVSKLICRCYENLKPDAEEVRSWKSHPVFDEDLWVWIEDTKEGRYAGLGIAELDESVPEASLEWIQILPEYRGKGLGKAVIFELINRVKDKVEFITVSGEMDTAGQLRRFYKSCGFGGDDIWNVLRK